jgi:hypothetical protein
VWTIVNLFLVGVIHVFLTFRASQTAPKRD